MAKKRNTPSKKISSAAISKSTSVDKSSGRFKEILKNPAIKYIAAEMATTALTKFFTKFSNRYPELTKILTSGLDSIEEKLVDFKNNIEGDTHLQQ